MTTKAEIRSDCEADFCPAWVPQAVRDKVWAKAWEHGHSSGVSEILFFYDDFMDIVRAFLPLKVTADELADALDQLEQLGCPQSAARARFVLSAYRKATEEAQ